MENTKNTKSSLLVKFTKNIAIDVIYRFPHISLVNNICSVERIHRKLYFSGKQYMYCREDTQKAVFLWYTIYVL
jgi:hypothetical protein